MPVPSLLAVFAHPDDESLSAGGVLARHASAGARTAVVTATWSADSPRATELAGALHILGAGPPRMLGHADSRVPHSAPGSPRWCDAPLDEAARELVAHLRDFRPEIVVTHDAYGGLTGHEGHVHTHRVTTLAVHAAGLERLCPDAGEPWQPSALYLATHPHSAARAWGVHLAPRARRCARSRTHTSPPPSTSPPGRAGRSRPSWPTARRWRGEPPRASSPPSP
ncbi:PIG-L deacetylase family protein [Streptomyces sp. NPDC057424]|uniref:PIG-L deacetylase family protein n=1 Tax=Streptomyces sp. NPDC057424 TaxID=3346127 RepID=UPI0036B4B079